MRRYPIPRRQLIRLMMTDAEKEQASALARELRSSLAHAIRVAVAMLAEKKIKSSKAA